MSGIKFDELHWPCTISNDLKHKLLNIAQRGSGLQNIQNSTEFPGIYYITSGLGIISFTSADMSNVIGCVIGTNDWLGAYAIENDADIFFLSVELEPLEYLFFPKQKIDQLKESTPEMFKFLYYCLIQVQPKYMQALITALHDKEIRIVYALLALAEKKQVINGAKISINITQEQLSIATGLSRPRINEVLKNIEKHQEISLDRGKIYFLDPKALGDRLNQLNTMFSDPRVKQ